MRFKPTTHLGLILLVGCVTSPLMAQETVRAVSTPMAYPAQLDLPWQDSDQARELGALAPQQSDAAAEQQPVHSPFDPSTMSSDTWPTHPIQRVRLDIRNAPSQKTPVDRSSTLIDSSSNRWEMFAASEKLFCWCAPNIRYQPLWFEDVPLERYGQTYCDYRIQTAASAAHFFLSTLTLPYHAVVDPYYECDYPLGFYRPGNCTPSLRQKFLYRW